MNRPILVGIDGSSTSEAALDWAASEARLREAGLRLLHAQPGLEAQADPDAADYGPLVAAAEERVHRSSPELEISQVRSSHTPAAALVAAASDAELVVVGNRGHGGFAGLLLGSVALQVAGHAPCPVVLVPDEVRTETRTIVVGFGTGQTDAVLRVAFEEAALHGATLRVLHGWRPSAAVPVSPGEIPVVADLAEERNAAANRVESALTPWRGKHQIAELNVDLVNEQPREVLIDAGVHADLVVVGAHDDVGRHVMPLGSVAGPVAHHARCPVLIVR